MRSLFFLILLSCALPCAAAKAPPKIRLENAFPKLKFEHPVLVTHAGDQSHRLFVVEQAGKLRLIAKGAASDSAPVFLDISSKVRFEGGEEGLLSLAFHPRFRSNRQFFVVYSVAGADPRATVLSRFETFADDPQKADPASEKVILRVEKLYSNHNGATVAFGPDGYLYLSLGDGGAGGDPHGNGQNLKSLLGKILRIDIDHASADRPYAIPKKNPFGNEVWAYGLRNVWRMSFDPESGDLWAGDVGQNKWEEIDRIKRGGNYGWNFREGAHVFKGEPKGAKLIEPVLDYGRKDGYCVTGGGVYRGHRLPFLKGFYVFGDFGSRKIWAFPASRAKKPKLNEIAQCEQGISSFGMDENGEFYVVGYDGTLFGFQ